MFSYHPLEGDFFIDLAWGYHQVCFLRCLRFPEAPQELYATGYFKDQRITIALSELSGDYFPNLESSHPFNEEFEELRLYSEQINRYLKRMLYETPHNKKTQAEVEQRVLEKFHLPPEWLTPLLKYALCHETLILFQKTPEGEFFTIPSIYHRKPGKRLNNQSIIDKLFLE